jgi:hypothetical protein
MRVYPTFFSTQSVSILERWVFANERLFTG